MHVTQTGNTPLDRCDYLSEKYNCHVYLKKEFHNPSGSAKDRPALNMINEAIRQHKLPSGSTLVEASSGNTGIAIAYYARRFGYRAVIFVSKSCSEEKLKELDALGAQVIVCENSNGIEDTQSTQYRAAVYAEQHKHAFYTDQYSNDDNYRAHLASTGPEIWEQTDGQVSHFVAGIGTGGTIRGVGTFLKRNNPAIRVVGVEPFGSVLSYYKAYGVLPAFSQMMEKISGIGRTFLPEVFDPAVVDQIMQVGAQRAKEIARDYAAQTGLPVGFSSAAVLCGLEDYVARWALQPQDRVVLLFADHGDRYKRLLYLDKATNEAGNYASL